MNGVTRSFWKMIRRLELRRCGGLIPNGYLTIAGLLQIIMMRPMDKLEAGLEVAEDVFNVNGMLLLGKGTMLTDRHIRILKTWGVDSVRIEGDTLIDPGPEIVIPPEFITEAEKKVQNRFRLINSTAGFVSIIRNLAVKSTARRLFEESHSHRP